MIDRDHKLSLVKQCRTLDISRSGIYYKPKAESEENLGLMRLIDEIHLKRPFLGVRRVTDELRARGHLVNRKRVFRLMRLMGVGYYVYPYGAWFRVSNGGDGLV